MAKNLTPQDVQSLTGLSPQDLATSLGIGDKFAASQEAAKKLKATKDEAVNLRAQRRANERSAAQQASAIQEAQYQPIDYEARLAQQQQAQEEYEQAPTLSAAFLDNTGALGTALGIGGLAADTAGNMVTGFGDALSTNPAILAMSRQVDDSARAAYAKKMRGEALTASEQVALDKPTKYGESMGNVLDAIATLRQEQSDKLNDNIVDNRTAELVTQGITAEDTDKLGEGVSNIFNGKGDFSTNISNVLDAAGSIAKTVGSNVLEHPQAAFTQTGSTIPYMAGYRLGPAGVGALFGADTGTNTTQNALQAGQRIAGPDSKLTAGEAAALATPEDLQRALKGGQAAAAVAMASEAASFGLAKAVTKTFGKAVSKDATNAATRGLVSDAEVQAAGLAKRGAALEAATATKSAERAALSTELENADKVRASLFDKVNNGTATVDEYQMFNQASETVTRTRKSLTALEKERVAAVEQAKQVTKDLSPEEYNDLFKRNLQEVKAHNARVTQQRADVDDAIKAVQDNPSSFPNAEQVLDDLRLQRDSIPALRAVPKAPSRLVKLGKAVGYAGAATVAEGSKEFGEEGTEEAFAQYGSGELEANGFDANKIVKSGAIGFVAGVAGGHQMHVASTTYDAGKRALQAGIAKIRTKPAESTTTTPIPPDTGFSDSDLEGARQRNATGTSGSSVSDQLADHYTKLVDTGVEGSMVSFENANPTSTFQDWGNQHPEHKAAVGAAIQASQKAFKEANQTISDLTAKRDSGTQLSKQENQALADATNVLGRAAALGNVATGIALRAKGMGAGTNKATLFSHHNSFEGAVNDFNTATDEDTKLNAQMRVWHHSNQGIQGVDSATVKSAVENAKTAEDKKFILNSHANAVETEVAKLATRMVQYAGAKGKAYSDVTNDVAKQVADRLHNFSVGIKAGDKAVVDNAISGINKHRDHQIKKLNVLNNFITAMQNVSEVNSNPKATQQEKAEAKAKLEQVHASWSNDYLDQASEYRNLSNNKLNGLLNMRTALVNEVNQLGAMSNHMSTNASLQGVTETAESVSAYNQDGTQSAEPADTVPTYTHKTPQKTTTSDTAAEQQPTTTQQKSSAPAKVSDSNFRNTELANKVKDILKVLSPATYNRFFNTDTAIGSNATNYVDSKLPALAAVFKYLYANSLKNDSAAMALHTSQQESARTDKANAQGKRDVKLQQRVVAAAFNEFLKAQGMDGYTNFDPNNDTHVDYLTNFLRSTPRTQANGKTDSGPVGLSIINAVGSKMRNRDGNALISAMADTMPNGSIEITPETMSSIQQAIQGVLDTHHSAEKEVQATPTVTPTPETTTPVVTPKQESQVVQQQQQTEQQVQAATVESLVTPEPTMEQVISEIDESIPTTEPSSVEVSNDIVEDTVVAEDVTASATHDEVLGNQISAGFINDEERQMGADLITARNNGEIETAQKLREKLSDATHFLSRSLKLMNEGRKGAVTRLLRGSLPGTRTSNIINFELRKFAARSVLGQYPGMMHYLVNSPVKALAAWIANGDITAINEAHKDAAKNFVDFYKTFGDALQSILAMPDRSANYAHQNWIAEFIEQDADGNPVINDQLKTALAAGVFQALQTQAHNTVFVDNKDTALSFALNEDGIPIANKNTEAGTVALPSDVMREFNSMGTPMHTFASIAAKAAYRALGIKLANNSKVNADEKLQLAFQSLIEATIRAGGLPTAKVTIIRSGATGITSVAEFNNGKVIERVKEEGIQAALSALEGAGIAVGNQQVSLITFGTKPETSNFHVLHPDTEQMLKTDDNAGGLVEQLSTTKYERQGIFTSPDDIHYSANERIGDTEQTVAPAIIERFKKLSASGFVPTLTGLMFELFNDETKLGISGAATEEDINNTIEGLKPSLEGQRKTYSNDIKVLSATYNKLATAAISAGKVLNSAFLKVANWGNGRFGYDSDFNPVSTKLHRNMWKKDEWTTTFNIGDAVAYRRMMSAIAEGFDITTDKQFLDKRLERLNTLLADPVMEAGIQALMNVHEAMEAAGMGNFDVTSMQASEFLSRGVLDSNLNRVLRENSAAIVAAVKKGGMNAHSLLALDTYARYLAAKVNEDTTFTHSLYEEVDGVTNGMSFILTHYSNLGANKYRVLQAGLREATKNKDSELANQYQSKIDSMHEELFKQLARVGVFAKDSNYTEWKNSPEAGNGDTYEAFAAAINTKYDRSKRVLQKLQTKLNSNSQAKSANWMAASRLLNSSEVSQDMKDELQNLLGQLLNKSEMKALLEGKYPSSKKGEYIPNIYRALDKQIQIMNSVEYFISAAQPDGTRKLARNSVKPLVMLSGYGAGIKSLYRVLITESLIPSYYKKMQTLQDIKTQLNQGKTVSDAVIMAAINDANDAAKHMAVLVAGTSANFRLNIEGNVVTPNDSFLMAVDDNGNAQPLTLDNIRSANNIGHFTVKPDNSKKPAINYVKGVPEYQGTFTKLLDTNVTGAMSTAIRKHASPVHESGVAAAREASFGNAFHHRDMIVQGLNTVTSVLGAVVVGRFNRARMQLAETNLKKYLAGKHIASNQEFADEFNDRVGTNLSTTELSSFLKEFTRKLGGTFNGDFDQIISLLDQNSTLGNVIPMNSRSELRDFYKEMLVAKFNETELSRAQEHDLLGKCLDLLPVLHNQLTQTDKDELANKWHGLLLADKIEYDSTVNINSPANRVTTAIRNPRNGKTVTANQFSTPRGAYGSNGAATNVLPVHHTDALIQLLTSDSVQGMLNLHDAVAAGVGADGSSASTANQNFLNAFDNESVPQRLTNILLKLHNQLHADTSEVTGEFVRNTANPFTEFGNLFKYFKEGSASSFDQYLYAVPGMSQVQSDLEFAGKTAEVEVDGSFESYMAAQRAMTALAVRAYNDVTVGHQVMVENIQAVSQYARPDLTAYADTSRTSLVQPINVTATLGSHAGSASAGGTTTGRADIKDASDVVTVFNALGNIGTVQDSDEHTQHLGEIAANLISKAVRPITVLFKSINEGNTSFGSVSGDTVSVVTATKPSKLKPWVRGALRMSSQEVYVHEMLHAISQWGIENIPGAARVIDTIRLHAKHELETNPKWEDFRKDNAEMLQRVFYPTVRADGMTDHNHEFVSYGLSNAAMVDFLKQVTAPKINATKLFAGDNVFAKLSNFLTKTLEFITNKFRGLDSSNAYNQLYDLTTRITQIQENHDSMVTRIANAVDKLAPFETVNEALRKGLGKLASIPNDASYSRTGKVLKGSAIAAQMFFSPDNKSIPKTVIGKAINKQITSLLNTLDNSQYALARDLAQNIYAARGNTDENADLLRIQRKNTAAVDSKRQLVVDTAIKTIRSTFGADTKLDGKTAEMMHKVFHRADIGSLLVQGKTLEDMHELLTNQSSLDSYINALKSELLQQKDGKYYVVQAENLGHYQIHEESFLELPRMNAYAISRGVQNATNASADVVGKIDALVTLHALNAVLPSERGRVAEVIKKELQQGDINGVGTTLGILQDIKQRQRTTRGLNQYAVGKVLMSEKYDDRITMRSSTSPNDQTLLDMSYTLSHTLPAVPEFGIPATYVYVNQYGGFSQSQESAMKFFRLSNGKGIPVDVNTEVANRDDILLAKTGRDSKHYSSGSLVRSKPVNMIPQYAASGAITGYIRNLPASFKDNNLMRVVDFAESIANTQGVMHVLETQHTANENVVAVLKDMYDKQYQDNPKVFVEIDMNSPNPQIRSYARKMTPETWNQVHKVFGEGKPFMVRKDVLGNVFGINKFSFSETWEKDPAERNIIERTIYDITTRLFGRDALAKVNAADDKWKAFVSLAKDRVVIASVVNAIDNTKSNITSLKLHGIPSHKIAADTLEGMNEVMQYASKQRQLTMVENKLKAIGLSKQSRSKLQVQRANLVDQLRTSPVRFMVDQGFMQSIEELTGDEVSSAVEKIGLLQKLNEKYKAMPGMTQDVLDNLLITKNTKLYSFLKDFTQLGDFAARYALIKHLTTRKTNPMGLEEAADYASDYFIYYATPNGRMTQLADDYGALPFIKYTLRVQKHILGTMRRYPVQSAVAVGLSMAAGFGVPGIFGSLLTLPKLMNKLRTPFDTVDMLFAGAGTRLVI